MSSPRRVADTLFRWDMVGPTFGNFATSAVGLLLILTLVMEVVLPPWTPMLEGLDARLGKPWSAFVMGACLTTASFWGVGTLLALPAFFTVEKFKIQRNKRLDWSALRRSMPLIVFNHCLGIVVCALAVTYGLPAADWRRLPDARALAREVATWLVCEEVIFYYGHRWLHVNKTAYARIHKLHHTWTAPISYVAIYAHPVEHVLSNLLPLLAGPLLCQSHLASFFVFASVGIMHTMAVHSGYWVCDDKGAHDEHHRVFNVNYGVMGFLDWIHGTYQLPPSVSATAAPRAVTETSGSGRKVSD